MRRVLPPPPSPKPTLHPYLYLTPYLLHTGQDFAATMPTAKQPKAGDMEPTCVRGWEKLRQSLHELLISRPANYVKNLCSLFLRTASSLPRFTFRSSLAPIWSAPSPSSAAATTSMSTTAVHGPTAQAAGHFTSHEQLVNHKEALESASAAATDAAHQERDRLLSRMRGATVTIPDIQAMMSHWPQGVNPEIERLERDSQEMLAWYVASINPVPIFTRRRRQK